MKPFRYAVTFELPETAPPLTIRGTVAGEQAQTLVHRAVVAAKRQAPGKQWSSLVVLVERVRERETSAQDAHGTVPDAAHEGCADTNPVASTPDRARPHQPAHMGQTGGLEDD